MLKTASILLGRLLSARLALSVLDCRNPSPSYLPGSANYERLGVDVLEVSAYRWVLGHPAELFRPPGNAVFIGLSIARAGETRETSRGSSLR